MTAAAKACSSASGRPAGGAWVSAAGPGKLILLAVLGASHVSCLFAPPTTTATSATTAAVCQLRDARITEASGIAASRRYVGLYYVHNDSGDKPQVYVVDREGRTRATIRLRGASAIDYEDISLAPGAKPGTFDVCAADIGDNNARRPNVVIYRFPEPELDTSRTAEVTIDVEAAAFRVRYADGPANAEAFCVHPRTGDGYILTKRIDGTCRVYKLTAPWDATHETELARLATVELPPATGLARVVTAADIAPDGRQLAVRCYFDGWEWQLPADAKEADFDDIFKLPPTRLSLPAEPQGEGLCYSVDGKSFLTISEGASPTLYETSAP